MVERAGRMHLVHQAQRQRLARIAARQVDERRAVHGGGVRRVVGAAPIEHGQEVRLDAESFALRRSEFAPVRQPRRALPPGRGGELHVSRRASATHGIVEQLPLALEAEHNAARASDHRRWHAAALRQF